MKDPKVSEFDLKDLLPIGLSFVVLGIALTYGLNVVGDVQDDMTICSNASNYYNSTSHQCQIGDGTLPGGQGFTSEYNASGDTILGVAEIPDKLPLIATVVVAAVIIGILVRYLMVRF